MIEPIPLSLLIHSCTVVTEKKDSWGDKTQETTTTLQKIRIDETKVEYISDKQNKKEKCDAVLYFDCRNSLPSGFTFKIDSRVIFDGTDYSIKSIKRYNTNKPHHYEVRLSL